MAYELRRNVTKLPEKGKGYPTVDDEGNITLPKTGETLTPKEYLSVKVTSDESEPSARPGYKSSMIVDGPRPPHNPARPSARGWRVEA